MNPNPPKVSIGLPVYNGADFIEEAINSILNQTFQDFELIICDNCSEDDTERICNSFTDGRIRYFRNEKNLGAAYNYNKAYKLSRGEYFKWAAHDDTLAPTYLEECLQVLENDPSVALCFPNTVVIDENHKEWRKINELFHLDSPSPTQRLKRYLILSGKMMLCHPVFGLIRKSALEKTDLIGTYHTSDYILLCQLSLLGKFKVLPKYLFYRRLHAKRSLRANRSVEDIAVWFDPSNKGKRQFKNLRLLKELFNLIKVSGLGVFQKFLCYLYSFLWIRRKAKALLIEMLSLTRIKRNKNYNCTSSDIKIVILAGKNPSIHSEESGLKHKALIEVGGKPIIWHLMKHCSNHGFKDFIIDMGDDGEMIRSELPAVLDEEWGIEFVDTSNGNSSDGWIRKLVPYLNNTFMVTGCDSVSDLDLGSLLSYHRSQRKLATVAVSHSMARTGLLEMNGNKVVNFLESGDVPRRCLNGGFFMLEPDSLNYLAEENSQREVGLLHKLAREGQLVAFKHDSFSQCVDSEREKKNLEQMWNAGNAPWKTW